MVSYEGLHENFATEVRCVGETLGMVIDDELIEPLRKQTNLGQLRERYGDEDLYSGDRFFRKGVIGDWHNHFDTAMARDIERIEANGIRPFDWRSLRRRALSRIPGSRR